MEPIKCLVDVIFLDVIFLVPMHLHLFKDIENQINSMVFNQKLL
jgi:hypothetical protein